MSPGTIRVEPEYTNELKAAYKEGYEAGVAHAISTMKGMIKDIDKDYPATTLYTTTSI